MKVQVGKRTEIPNGRKLSKKQMAALGKLHWEDPTKFVFYGGAAGGGKTWLGCYWLMTMCWRFPGTRWFIGRDSLKDTRESVVVTFDKVAKAYGFTQYSKNDHDICFDNGSTVVFLDLSYYPVKDPMFERFGSKEFTGGWIEEAGEVHFAAFDTLKSRIGRHMNAEYGIKPKMLITANPKKNWLYTEFWKPYKAKTLSKDYAFIRALYSDNIGLTDDYIQMLKSLKDKVKRERLLKGNFDYDDNPNSLCSFDSIQAIFGGNVPEDDNNYYLTADIARFGSDKAIIAVWKGWSLIHVTIYDISKTTDLQAAITALRRKYKIPKDRCIADEDGVGGGVVDNCEIIGFVNNSTALDNVETGEPENYYNLQSQMGYKLAEIINDRKMNIECDLTPDMRDDITTELEQLQTWKSDDDRKMRIKPKKEIKAEIGRSPDWRDVLLMRAYFEYVDTTAQDLSGVFF